MSREEYPTKAQLPPKQLELEPLQLAALLVLDGACITLQTGINQLGGFLGLKREAEILGRALAQVQTEKEKLVQEWQQKVVVAPAAALNIINGAMKP